MMELLKEDLAWCVRRLPKDVYDLLKKSKDTLFVAGGFIRARISNEKPSDIDIFSSSDDIAFKYAKKLARDYFKVVKTDNAYTVCGNKRLAIQFIKKWNFSHPSEVLPSFDFTIARAMFWWDGNRWQSLCDDRFYPDLAAKRLVYCSPIRIEEVGGSIMRVLKFYQRGYRIPLDSLGAVVARLVSGVDMKRSDVSTEEQMALILSGLLREVDPTTDPDHISHLPSLKDID